MTDYEVISSGSADGRDVEVVSVAVSGIPPDILENMVANGITFVCCRDAVTDHIKELKGVTPRGWEKTGRTWDSVPGAYFVVEKQVVIATSGDDAVRAVPTRSPNTHGSAGLVIHESIHGFDYVNNHSPINSRAFQLARAADQLKLGPYEAQDGQAGLEETYAESAARFVREPTILQLDWPHLFAFWQEAIEAGTNLASLSPTARGRSSINGQAPDVHPVGTVSFQPGHGINFEMRPCIEDQICGHSSFVIGETEALFGSLFATLWPSPTVRRSTKQPPKLFYGIAGADSSLESNGNNHD